MRVSREGNLFLVESESRKGKFYKVDPVKPSCTCPGYLFHMRPQGQVCKHIKAVRGMCDSSAIDKIVDYVNANGDVDAVTLIEMYGEQAVNALINAGELIELGGRIRRLK
ncbi:MAG: SWIM zinc finger family protein [archaeon]